MNSIEWLKSIGENMQKPQNAPVPHKRVAEENCTLEEEVQTTGGLRGNLNISELPPVPAEVPMPFYTPGGDLSIPFGSDPKYHWWKPGGQSLEQTRADVRNQLAEEQMSINC